MPAANTDKFRKKKNTFSTNLNGSITNNATSLTCDSLTGVPTDTAVTITIDRVDANSVSTPSLREDVTGVVSGNNLTNLVRGEGSTSAQSHEDNAVVEITWETETWNDAVDALLAEHDQDGTHGAITPASVNINGTVVITGTLDEDTMATDSAVKLATQQSIKAYVDKNKSLSIEVFGGTSNVVTGDGKAYFTIPSHLNGAVIDAVHARVVTAGTTNTTDIQIANVTDSVDVLSTKLTIDSGETGSDTAATPAVINTSNDDVATNDLFRIDVDAVSSTAPKGLVVRIEFGNA